MRLLRLYPLLASVHPVLHLAAANANEWLYARDVLGPLAIATAVPGVAWLGVATVTRDADKRAFLTCLAVLAFGWYAYLGSAVARLPGLTGLAPDARALLFLGIVGTCVALGTRHTRRSFVPVTRFLSTMTLLLVFFTVGQLVLARSQRAVVVHRTPASLPIVPAGPRPTIYLIVLDKYTGGESLRSYYGFDNTLFEQALRDRGFALPRVQANYTYTRHALISLMNWEYLDSLGASVGTEVTDWRPLLSRWEDNRTMHLLKELDYEIIYFPNPYEPFTRSRQADLHLPDPSALRPEFETVWRGTTMLTPLVAIVCSMVHCAHAPWDPESTSLIDWKFGQLGPLAATTRPRFIMAHLLVPHEPYVYRADCSHVPTRHSWPDSSAMRAGYLAQIQCVNRKVLDAVDAILRISPMPPVILIQSDHGDGHLPKEPMELVEASPAMVRARLDVFAAYYVPGAPDTLFYDGMTPINLLPRVFNFLFGANFSAQPDRSEWVITDQPYRTTPIPAGDWDRSN